MSAPQNPGIFRERRDDAVDHLLVTDGIGFVVRDINAVTTDEPDTQHNAFHVHAH